MSFEQAIEQRSFDPETGRRLNARHAERTAVERPGVGYSPVAMRVLDLMIAGTALVFLAPLLIFIALACRVSDPGPVFFAHSRCGRGGKMFGCLKFRSMVVDADQRLDALLASDAGARAEWTATHKLTNDPRITPLGRFLRKSSLDELPQLINVLRGEMSLVGPRPIVQAEISRYGRYIADYNRVLPGITGMWQVSGRSETDYRQRVALDLLYIRKYSVGLYLRILVLTIPAVLLRKGAY